MNNQDVRVLQAEHSHHYAIVSEPSNGVAILLIADRQRNALVALLLKGPLQGDNNLTLSFVDTRNRGELEPGFPLTGWRQSNTIFRSALARWLMNVSEFPHVCRNEDLIRSFHEHIEASTR